MVGGLWTWTWVWAWLGVIWLCVLCPRARRRARLPTTGDSEGIHPILLSSRRAGARGHGKEGHHDGTTPQGISRAGDGIGRRTRCD